MDVGVIVLSWNSKPYIGECLSGLLRHEPECRVYVIDNGSIDGSADYIAREFPSVILIRSPGNLGFAGGNNVGIGRALVDGCGVIALLNNDTVIDEPFLRPCVKVLEREGEVGIVGPIIVDADEPGRVQFRGGRIAAWRLGFPYMGRGERYVRSDMVEKVDYVLGAAMIMRRDVIEKTGGLDPEYFPAYVEEADLCYRAREYGFESAVCHAVRVRHVGGKSSGGEVLTRRRMQVNRFRFAVRHLGVFRFLLAAHLLIVGVIVGKITQRKFF